MPGLACFVGRTEGPKFVCSAVPPAEVQAQPARLGLTPHSQRIYASHRDQAMALRDIQWQRPELRVLFLGDAPQDLAAATAAGVSFVAVVGERDALPGQALPKLQDFSDELLVERCLLKGIPWGAYLMLSSDAATICSTPAQTQAHQALAAAHPSLSRDLSTGAVGKWVAGGVTGRSPTKV